MVFQHQPVRTSTCFYARFTLAMGRSPGFGSTTDNYSPYSDSLSLRLRGPLPLTSLPVVTRRLILQQARSRAFEGLKSLRIALPLLVDTRFQVLFHSPPGVLFHLSLTVLLRYR